MCECSVKKMLQQLQQKEQKRIWQVCFSRILGLNTVDRHIFLGRGLGGDVGLFSLFQEALAEKCQSEGMLESHHPFLA